MSDPEPQTAGGKVLWHFTMSLDGFVAGPNHEMDWMTGISFRPSLVGEYVKTTGAVLGGRDGWDHATSDSRPYGGAWDGPIFVLTHHPQDVTPSDGVTFLNCDPAEAVRIGLAAAVGKNLEVFSPTIGRLLLELGLIDEIDLHIAPILLGGGIRLYHNPAVSRSASTGSAKATPPRPSTYGTDPPQQRRLAACSGICATWVGAALDSTSPKSRSTATVSRVYPISQLNGRPVLEDRTRTVTDA